MVRCKGPMISLSSAEGGSLVGQPSSKLGTMVLAPEGNIATFSFCMHWMLFRILMREQQERRSWRPWRGMSWRRQSWRAYSFPLGNSGLQ